MDRAPSAAKQMATLIGFLWHRLVVQGIAAACLRVQLAPDTQAESKRIDLRWHDLGHGHASRLVEKGVPLAQVRDLLDHASIVTTERSDNQ